MTEDKDIPWHQRIPKEERCDTCEGVGSIFPCNNHDSRDMEDCPDCNGTGRRA